MGGEQRSHGHEPVTNRVPGNREVLRLAVPMILSNITIPLLGVVDSAVVGHLPGAHHLGAVAVGAMVFTVIFWGFGFLRMGTTGFVAQAWGRDDLGGVRLRMAQAGLIALTIAAVVLLLQRPFAHVAFTLVEATPAVEAGARAYFAIRIWAAPATLVSYVLIGSFLGAQNARAPLAIMLLTNVTNIVLDLVFVVGLEWGVPGVAAASVIGEYLGMGLGLMLARRHGLLSAAGLTWARVVERSDFLAVLRVNGDILLRTLCLIFAFAFFTREGAALGELTLAANAVLMNFQHFMSYGLDGFAHAAEALVGRTLGARDNKALRATVRRTGYWSAGVALACAAAYAVAGTGVVNMITNIESVRGVAYQYLPWLVLDGVFIGATRGREMRNAMMISTAGVFLPVWYLTRPLGNHGLWLALMAFMLARALTMGWYYRRCIAPVDR
jgi:MATE family multidrug resistance protein